MGSVYFLNSFCTFFFFSSRRRHTRCSRDWSSDVCSSDLGEAPPVPAPSRPPAAEAAIDTRPAQQRTMLVADDDPAIREMFEEFFVAKGYRSEERRVGKEGRSRWSPYH